MIIYVHPVLYIYFYLFLISIPFFFKYDFDYSFSNFRTYSSSSNFRKGNYIELANGTLRRVEDMRTEDFIQCAERSPHHQLAESTVVKINTSLPTMAVITFSYDRNRAKVN